jgi:hypothetical protein
MTSEIQDIPEAYIHLIHIKQYYTLQYIYCKYIDKKKLNKKQINKYWLHVNNRKIDIKKD